MTIKLTVALCSYNRAERLPELIRALRSLESEFPFQILVVNNNSADNTTAVLEQLTGEPGAPLRTVVEMRQGICPARNRALQECMNEDYMLFMDDDELPGAQFIQAAMRGFEQDGADVVGGKVCNQFLEGRPSWLGDDLLPFLAEVDYGEESVWITDRDKTLWTANIGYRMKIFSDHPDLRFDDRYNRQGKGIGGGEDAIMFRQLLETHDIRIRYLPDMLVKHYVETWRLKRSYFLKLHYLAGKKAALYDSRSFARTLLGVPLFMLPQTLSLATSGLAAYLRDDRTALRECMNAAHAFGQIRGYFIQRARSKES